LNFCIIKDNKTYAVIEGVVHGTVFEQNSYGSVGKNYMKFFQG